MSPRRGFLALVGGAFVTGAVGRTASATPTLLLPPQLVTDVPDMSAVTGASARPLLEAMLARDGNRLRAYHDVMTGLPDPLVMDWLESGLRMLEDCKPGGGVFRHAVARTERVPEPPKRFIGPGGRTAQEQAYLLQCIDDLQTSLDRDAAWSNTLPIRQTGRGGA